MDLLTMNRYVSVGIYPKTDPIVPDIHHGYDNVFVDDDLLVLFSTQYKHAFPSRVCCHSVESKSSGRSISTFAVDMRRR